MKTKDPSTSFAHGNPPPETDRPVSRDTVVISKEHFEQLVGSLRESLCYLKMYNEQIAPLSIRWTLGRIVRILKKVGGDAQVWSP